MEIRPAKSADLPGVLEIDATTESHRYLHVDRSGDGLSVQIKIEDRPLRERSITQSPMDDETQFLFKQITGGIDEGIATVIDLDGPVVASVVAQSVGDVYKILDLRVDFDHRREGFATALVYQVMQAARESEARAVAVETTAQNHPAAAMLEKLQFQVAGVDTFRRSNHDLVKEAVTILWYLPLT